ATKDRPSAEDVSGSSGCWQNAVSVLVLSWLVIGLQFNCGPRPAGHTGFRIGVGEPTIQPMPQ
ncbi:MAG: hypothetical protein ACO35I_03455, partial [Burkholderiaceae bacterium]